MSEGSKKTKKGKEKSITSATRPSGVRCLVDWAAAIGKKGW
jgi:hypothetical protein